MVNGINTSIKASTQASSLVQKEIRQAQNENANLKEKEQVQLSRVEQIKEQIKNGTYKIDLQQTSEKMASNLLNL